MNPWIFVIGWTLIHFVWQGALIALGTATVLRLWRRGSGDARYAVACVGLAAMLASPALTAGVLWTSTAKLDVTDNTLSAARGSQTTVALPRVSTGDAGSPANGVATRGSGLNRWLSVVVWCWLTGVTTLMVRFAGGYWRIHRLRASAVADGVSQWQRVGERLAVRLRLRLAFHVVESRLVDAPTVIGWIRPVVLLPMAALTNLTPLQIEALLAHELAHIRRRDYAINLLQTCTETLLFYHPGVWWVSARIREERECCCDDIAVDACGEPAAYAAALVELASWRVRDTALAVAATDGSLLKRVGRLLRVPEDNQPQSISGLVVLALGIAVATGVALQSSPPLAVTNAAIVTANPVSSEPVMSGELPAVGQRDAVAVRGQAATEAGPPTAEWHIFQTDHFEIYYEPDSDLHARRVAQEAERAYEQISADLKHSLAFRIPVILFRTTNELQQNLRNGRLGLPHVASAEPYRLLLPTDRPADQWFGLITHEVTHVFGFDIVPGTATPRPITEGLAEYQRGAWDPDDLAALRDAVRANAIPAVTDFAGDAGSHPRLVYGLGHALFDFVESRWGKAGVRQFLFWLRQTATSGGDPYAGAFQLTQAAFERDYQQYLWDRFGRAASQSPAVPPDNRATVRIEGGAAPVAAPSQNETVYLPDDGVSIPVLVNMVKPVYTPQAQDAGIQGTVMLDAVVQPDGQVGEVTIRTSLDPTLGLDDQAVTALKQWVFAPGVLDGKPVPVLVQVEMTFALK